MPMSTVSMTTGQFREFAEAVLRSLPDELDHTTLQWWIENQENLRKILGEALRPNRKPIIKTYPLTVDYGRSVEDWRKAPHYYFSNSEINSRNFPAKRQGITQIVVELIHPHEIFPLNWYKDYVSTNEVLRELDRTGYRATYYLIFIEVLREFNKRTGYRPIDLYELFALGEKYPKLPREFPVVALDSVWHNPGGYYVVPYLGWNGLNRSLRLVSIEGNWHESYRFAVCK